MFCLTEKKQLEIVFLQGKQNGFVMLARLTTESRFFVFQMHPYQGFLEIGYYKPSVYFKGTSLFKILEIRAHEIKTNQA